MKKSRKNIISMILAVAIAIGAFLFYYSRTPRQEFKKIYGFELPSSVEINQYKYYSSDSSFFIKAKLSTDDCNQINEELEAYYNNIPDKESEYSHITNLDVVCSWWDFDVDDIITGYSHFMLGRHGIERMTVEVHSYIVKDDNNQLYLYFCVVG